MTEGRLGPRVRRCLDELRNRHGLALPSNAEQLVAQAVRSDLALARARGAWTEEFVLGTHASFVVALLRLGRSSVVLLEAAIQADLEEAAPVDDPALAPVLCGPFGSSAGNAY